MLNVASMAKANEIAKLISLKIVGAFAKRLDVVYVRFSAKLFSRYSAILTGITVACKRLLSLNIPVCTVIIRRSAAPSMVICANKNTGTPDIGTFKRAADFMASLHYSVVKVFTADRANSGKQFVGKMRVAAACIVYLFPFRTAFSRTRMPVSGAAWFYPELLPADFTSDVGGC